MPELSLRLPAEPENVIVVRELIRGVQRLLAVRPGLSEAVLTSVSEAANNVVMHAYDGTVGPLEVDVSLRGPLEVLVRDHGIGFDPRHEGDADDQEGLGRAVISAFADEVEVSSRVGAGSEVRLLWDVPPLLRATDGAGAVAFPGDIVLSLLPDPAFAELTGRVMSALGARARLPVDRLSDLQLIGDTLVGHAAGALAGSHLSLSFVRGRGRMEVSAGPFVRDGAGIVRLARSVAGEPLIDRLADEVHIVTDANGSGEALVFSVGEPA